MGYESKMTTEGSVSCPVTASGRVRGGHTAPVFRRGQGSLDKREMIFGGDEQQLVEVVIEEQQLEHKSNL